MPWFKVDDTFAFHPKIIGLSPSAGWLWTRAGAWCAQLLTDGAVPRKVIGALGGAPDDAAELVEAGLWTETDSGWKFHDWHDYQPTKEAVEAERAAARERQRKARAAAKAARDSERDSKGSHAVTSPDVTRDIRRESRSPHPIPSHPEPSSSSAPSEPTLAVVVDTADDDEKSTRRKPERPLPASWTPTAKHYEYALERGVDVASAVESFRNHAETHDRRARDWNAAFRTWLSRTKPSARPLAAPVLSAWDLKVGGGR